MHTGPARAPLGAGHAGSGVTLVFCTRAGASKRRLGRAHRLDRRDPPGLRGRDPAHLIDRAFQIRDGVEAARQIDHQRCVGGARARVVGQQLRERRAHLGRRPGLDARGRFEPGCHRVVLRHEPGAAHPADARADERRRPRPRLSLARPLREHHLERGLALGVRAVATKRAVVGRQRQQHMTRLRLATDDETARHQPHHALGAEHHRAQRRLRSATQLVDGADVLQRRERHDQIGRHRRLQHAHGRARLLGLGAEEPVDERVDVLK